MKLARLSYLFLGLLAGVLLFKPQPTAPKTEKFLYNSKAVTVLIDCSDGYGSGVCVSRPNYHGDYVTYVWTANHVVRSLFDSAGTNIVVVEVISNDGDRQKAEVIAHSEEGDKSDLALLRVKKLNWMTNSATFSHGAPLAIGSPVYHFGCFYGVGGHHSLSVGVVSYLNREPSLDQLDCAIYPGSSGGGVWSYNSGECIGLADARINGEERISLIVPSRVMDLWAKSHHVAWAIDLSVSLPIQNALPGSSTTLPDYTARDLLRHFVPLP